MIKFGPQLDGSDTDQGTSADEASAVPEETMPQDPEPGWDKPSLADRFMSSERPSASGTPPKKVTVAVRKDIKAKTAMLLTVFGGAWSARDPYCGPALVKAIPDQMTDEGVAPGVASALTDIFCDSPDIVHWFTSGGSYLKWFTLAMALQPVLTTAAAHHVTHRLGGNDEDPGAAPDWSQYRTR